MSDVVERFLLCTVGVATGIVVGYGLGRSTSGPASASSSGALDDGRNVQVRFIKAAAMSVAAVQWSDQMIEKKHSLSGQDILVAYEKIGPNNPPPEIVDWVAEQFASWKSMGGLSWVRDQLLKGEDLDLLAHLWILTVEGSGSGLWDDYEGYPEPETSSPPYVTLRYSKKLGAFR